MYSDAIAHKMVPAIAETHKMVPVKTVFDAHLHVSFPIHYQIDASVHKVVPVAGIVAQKVVPAVVPAKNHTKNMCPIFSVTLCYV